MLLKPHNKWYSVVATSNYCKHFNRTFGLDWAEVSMEEHETERSRKKMSICKEGKSQFGGKQAYLKGRRDLRNDQGYQVHTVTPSWWKKCNLVMCSHIADS